jgi:hypothetical protein
MDVRKLCKRVGVGVNIPFLLSNGYSKWINCEIYQWRVAEIMIIKIYFDKMAIESEELHICKHFFFFFKHMACV